MPTATTTTTTTTTTAINSTRRETVGQLDWPAVGSARFGQLAREASD